MPDPKVIESGSTPLADVLAAMSVGIAAVGLVLTMGFSLLMWLLVLPLRHSGPEDVGALLIQAFLVPVNAPGGLFFLVGLVFALVSRALRGGAGRTVAIRRLATAGLVANAIPLGSVLLYLVIRLST